MILASAAHIIWAFFFAVVSFLLMVVILLQRGRGVGLAGAFGGGGASATFGAKTGDMLTWVTITFAGVLLLLACILTKFVFVKQVAGLSGPTPVVAPAGSTGAAPTDSTPAPTPVKSTPAPANPAPSPVNPAPTPTNPGAADPASATPPASQPGPGGWILPRDLQFRTPHLPIFGEATA